MYKYILVLLVGLTACGKDGGRVTVTEYVNVSSPSPQVDQVQKVIDEENSYRAMAGQAMLTNGLTCSTYVNLSNALTNFPTSLPSANATYKYVGVFNQPNSSVSVGLNVIPSALRTQPLYQQWYALRCSGYLVITEDAYYSFELNSDDAGLLYLDNILVVDNNGLHGAQTRTGYRMLRRGVHQFRLDYMQGPAGNQSLVLTSGGVILPSNLFLR